MAQEQKTLAGEQKYETQFTKENIIALKNAINKGINTYAEENNLKLDIYVILAALQQSAYEVMIRTFTKDKEEAEQVIQKMQDVAKIQLETLDKNREENKTGGLEEILGVIHTASLISEWYARRRDKFMELLEQQKLNVEEEQSIRPQHDVTQVQEEALNESSEEETK